MSIDFENIPEEIDPYMSEEDIKEQIADRKYSEKVDEEG